MLIAWILIPKLSKQKSLIALNIHHAKLKLKISVPPRLLGSDSEPHNPFKRLRVS